MSASPEPRTSMPDRSTVRFMRVLLVPMLLLFGWGVYDWLGPAPDGYPHQHLKNVVSGAAGVALIAAGSVERRVVQRGLLTVSVLMMAFYLVLRFM